MSTAWDNAEAELGKDSLNKMLGFRYHDDVGQVTEYLSILNTIEVIPNTYCFASISTRDLHPHNRRL